MVHITAIEAILILACLMGLMLLGYLKLSDWAERHPETIDRLSQWADRLSDRLHEGFDSAILKLADTLEGAWIGARRGARAIKGN